MTKAVPFGKIEMLFVVLGFVVDFMLNAKLPG